ncbi:conserved hypothetical protein [Bradyrhizobium sp. STM 3809]|nr:conserved hypothetical protein [Bradyrhizobium sp. STM 3809]
MFARQDERDAIAKIARELNVPFFGLFLIADLRTRQERIEHRINDASDATRAVAQEQERYDLGMLDWAQVDASGTPEATLARSQSLLQMGQ